MRIIYIPMALMLIFFLSRFFHVKVIESPKACLLEKYRLSDMKPSKSLTLSYFEQLALFLSYFDSEEIIIS